MVLITAVETLRHPLPNPWIVIILSKSPDYPSRTFFIAKGHFFFFQILARQEKKNLSSFLHNLSLYFAFFTSKLPTFFILLLFLLVILLFCPHVYTRTAGVTVALNHAMMMLFLCRSNKCFEKLSHLFCLPVFVCLLLVWDHGGQRTTLRGCLS